MAVLPERSVIQKVRWRPLLLTARGLPLARSCHPQGHPHVPSFVTDPYLWSCRPLTSQLSSCAFVLIASCAQLSNCCAPSVPQRRLGVGEVRGGGTLTQT